MEPCSGRDRPRLAVVAGRPSEGGAASIAHGNEVGSMRNGARRIASRSAGSSLVPGIRKCESHAHQESAVSLRAQYAHGGVSLQECVIPELTVERGAEVATGPPLLTFSGEACACAFARRRPRLVLPSTSGQTPSSLASSLVASAKEPGR